MYGLYGVAGTALPGAMRRLLSGLVSSVARMSFAGARRLRGESKLRKGSGAVRRESEVWLPVPALPRVSGAGLIFIFVGLDCGVELPLLGAGSRAKLKPETICVSRELCSSAIAGGGATGKVAVRGVCRVGATGKVAVRGVCDGEAYELAILLREERIDGAKWKRLLSSWACGLASTSLRWGGVGGGGGRL
jgi:hypothetical protein